MITSEVHRAPDLGFASPAPFIYLFTMASSAESMDIVGSTDASAPEEKPSGAAVGDGASPATAVGDGAPPSISAPAAPAAAAPSEPARDEDLTKVRDT